MAGQMQCPECIGDKRQKIHPRASPKDMPGLFEIVGTDVFEYEHKDRKHQRPGKWYGNGGRAAQVHGHGRGHSWVILKVAHAQSWVLSDAGRQFTSEAFADFAARSGIGLMTAPAEAHWLLGAEEGCINILKSAVG